MECNHPGFSRVVASPGACDAFSNKLAERPEFDPVLQGVSPLKSLLPVFGIGRDPFSSTPEERVLDADFDRFTA
jgi:hypothetical protein